MKIDRYEMYTRFDGSVELVIDPEGSVCYTRDVERLEAINAELLEAAKEIIKWWSDDDCGICPSVHGMMDRLRAAITKAEGAP